MFGLTITTTAPPPLVREKMDSMVNGLNKVLSCLSRLCLGTYGTIASAKHSNPLFVGADALRQLYPGHSVVVSTDYNLNILSHPGVIAIPMEKTPLITNTIFLPIARGAGAIPGFLIDLVQFGIFKVAWDKYDYLLFVVQFPSGFGTTVARYLVHEGPEGPSRQLLLAIGAWSSQLHEEIWVFNEGNWQKDHGLWVDIQKGDWKDVILNDTFKKALQKDVYGFFSSEKVYKDLGIPWKRGLIMYGPPGNGKTISIKVIMKTCEEQGYLPLYVKSFQSWMGEERSMAEVFNHARQLSPCVLILEDLDSLINDKNRSFFLNQLDGLTGNDGLLVIGTTNHFDRLDPGLSSRPSRFDRKFKFDDPDLEGRTLYAKYWQNKLKDNKNISFTDNLVNTIATATEIFSFAYLKEAFVSSLVELAGFDGDDSEKPTFEQLIHRHIKSLRKELESSSNMKLADRVPEMRMPQSSNLQDRKHPNNFSDRVISLLGTLSESTRSPGGRQRVLLDASSASIQRATAAASNINGEYTTPAQESEWSRDIRERLIRLKARDF
ncbi:hypothetical protein H0H87_007936 [Tephrocybe sp. NHM501043]|nr:hypothetical protein H0H87_007936 [Tephrocybe sp. NHM501043]